jgi:predicted metal-dependent hydrolase
MKFVQFGNRKIFFEIERGNRKKTVTIHINPTGSITVLSPSFLDEGHIRKILYKKGKRIIEKQEQVKKNTDANTAKQFMSGESFPYLGRYYRLKVRKQLSEDEKKCRLVNGRFLVEGDGHSGSENGSSSVKRALIEWYMEHAEEKIAERVNRIARLIGKWPVSIKIKNQEKRWGSCSRGGIIRFNWKIVMAPISVMDYVITHELCHLIYPHHSIQFWQKVQSIIPDYEKKRHWLKKNSLQMDSLG